MEEDLVFIKLGGSLITDKNLPDTARLDLIDALVLAIKHAQQEMPGIKLILGHGSGSFGHPMAKKYRTREGVFTPEQWHGFHQTWRAAHALNQLVLESCLAAGLPVVNFPPSASILTQNHKVLSWELAPINAALKNGMIPLIYGDVVFDSIIGGTILSTEELFDHLARILKPARILLAGIEPGVWGDYPVCTYLIPHITASGLPGFDDRLLPSASVDVTGGMRAKVDQISQLVKDIPGLQARIFSAIDSKNLYRVIIGAPLGTLIS